MLEGPFNSTLSRGCMGKMIFTTWPQPPVTRNMIKQNLNKASAKQSRLFIKTTVYQIRLEVWYDTAENWYGESLPFVQKSSNGPIYKCMVKSRDE